MGEEGILLNTDFTGEMVKFDIKDGKAIIKEKEFIIDRIQPINLKKKRFGRMRIIPFYLLKWDKIEPANFRIVETEIDGQKYGEIEQANILNTLEVDFPANQEGDVLPEMLKETMDLRFMKHLKRYAGEGAGGKRFEFKRWMLIPIALILAGLAMFLINGGRFF